MEQLVIVLVIGAISLVKWLMEKSAEQRAARETERRIDDLQRNGPPAPPVLAPRPIAEPLPDFDKAARRLREALGLPEEAETPRPVEPRAPVFRPLPPPLPEEAPVRPKILFERPMLESVVDLERRVFATPIDPLPTPPRPVESKPAPPAISSRSLVEELLHSRDGLRKAILAQEILGTPKGLVF